MRILLAALAAAVVAAAFVMAGARAGETPAVGEAAPEFRLKDQDGEHHGGNRWIGTGGTSPVGHSGYHPGGMRVGGMSRNKSAVKVAMDRRYKDYSRGGPLTQEQLGEALKRLRAERAALEEQRRLEAEKDPGPQPKISGKRKRKLKRAGSNDQGQQRQQQAEAEIGLDALLDARQAAHAHAFRQLQLLLPEEALHRAPGSRTFFANQEWLLFEFLELNALAAGQPVLR